MLRGFINDAKSAAGSVVAKQAARAWVVVPLLIALGFLTAGVTITLVDRFGQRNAYLVLGAGFSVIGLLTALIVRSKEHEVVVAEEKAAKAETEKAHVASDTVAAAAAAAAELPLALLGALMSSSSGPISVAHIARLVGRNLPLVLFVAGLGFLLWPKIGGVHAVSANDDLGASANVPRPNGVDRSGNHHAAA